MNLTSLSDDELIQSIKSLTGFERVNLVAILKHLNEFENRRLAVSKGFPSLFDYCVRELHYAQGESLRRIRAARATKKFEILYRLIDRGVLSLTTVAVLEPHLKWDNYRRLIRIAKGLSTREVEALVASLAPIPAAPVERIRILSVMPPVPVVEAEDLFTPPNEIPHGAPAPAAPAAPAVRRVHFSFTGDERLLHDYERAKELSRHKWPDGRMEDVFAGAISALLAKIDPDMRTRRKERVRRVAAGVRSQHYRAR